MKESKILKIGLFLFAIFFVGSIAYLKFNNINLENINKIEGKILSVDNDQVILKENKDNLIYTFKVNPHNDLSSGDYIILDYLGMIDKLKTNQDNKVVSFKVINTLNDEEDKEEMFSKFYKQAQNKINNMSLDEKIKQLLLVRYKNNFIDGVGGYIFYENDFKDKEVVNVINMIDNLQSKTKIPFLTAVDEEGGKVVRISSNEKLSESRFKSSHDLYNEGGFPLIREDTINKSKLLKKLGINVNLAPVVDIAPLESSYIYERTIGYGKDITSEYAKTVISASKGSDVSYVLKHFPGYGNNSDTHTNISHDERSYEDIIGTDIIPFKEGINAGAEAVLVSHNIINSIDENNPASLSTIVHNLLRSTLDFTGVIITDDLDMGATSNIKDKYVKALNAGNDLLIVKDEEEALREIKNGLNNSLISEEVINDALLRVVSWKYYKGLIIDNDK